MRTNKIIIILLITINKPLKKIFNPYYLTKHSDREIYGGYTGGNGGVTGAGGGGDGSFNSDPDGKNSIGHFGPRECTIQLISPTYS